MNLSPLSPTKTEPFHIDSSHQIPRRISSPLPKQSNDHHNRQGLGCKITITTVRIDIIDARSARSACVHTAIVNTSAPMDGRNAHWLRSVFQTWSCFSHRAGCALSPWTDTCSSTMLNKYGCRGVRCSCPQREKKSENGGGRWKKARMGSGGGGPGQGGPACRNTKNLKKKKEKKKKHIFLKKNEK